MATRLERVNKEMSEFKVMPISWLTERLIAAGDTKVTENKIYELARTSGKHIFCVIKGICYYGPKPDVQETLTHLSADLQEVDKVDVEAAKQKLAEELGEQFKEKLDKVQSHYEQLLKESACTKEHAPRWIDKSGTLKSIYKEHADNKDNTLSPDDIYTPKLKKAIDKLNEAYEHKLTRPEVGDIAEVLNLLAMSAINQMQDYTD